jgi:hypothetical protein
MSYAKIADQIREMHRGNYLQPTESSPRAGCADRTRRLGWPTEHSGSKVIEPKKAPVPARHSATNGIVGWRIPWPPGQSPDLDPQYSGYACNSDRMGSAMRDDVACCETTC